MEVTLTTMWVSGHTGTQCPDPSTRVGTILEDEPFGPTQQAFKPIKSLPRSRRHAPRAADKGKSSKGGLDWDSAWSNFKDGLNKNIPVVEDRTAQRPESQQQPKSSNKSPQFARDSRRQLRENIKKQENLVLDFWSQELFFKAGGLFIAVLLVIFLLIGGPGGPD
ncbi:TPA: hypothetical protein ACH3X1_010886 [Trebouxia sp. C0004]